MANNMGSLNLQIKDDAIMQRQKTFQVVTGAKWLKVNSYDP